MNTGLWHCLAVREADAMADWLTAVGFEEQATYRDEQQPDTVMHAEYLWPLGGGVMFGTHTDQPDWPARPGTGAAYLVCTDCDDVFRRAVQAGGSVLRRPEDQSYGGRSAAVLDPEGNIWSMGTYSGEPQT